LPVLLLHVWIAHQINMYKISSYRNEFAAVEKIEARKRPNKKGV